LTVGIISNLFKGFIRGKKFEFASFGLTNSKNSGMLRSFMKNQILTLII